MTASLSGNGQHLSAGGRVIVGMKDAGHDSASLRWAASHARTHRMPVLVMHAYRLVVVPAVPVGYISPYVHEEEQRRSAEAITAHGVAVLRRWGADVSGLTICGDAGISLGDAAYVDDVLVVGTAGGGALRHALRGGTVHAVLRHAPCPVVVVPAGWNPSTADARVVLVDDGTEAARCAQEWTAQERGGAVVQTVALDDGGPVTDLLGAARGACMLVIGGHPTGWFGALAGRSTSEQAVLDPPCPVVVVPTRSPRAA